MMCRSSLCFAAALALVAVASVGASPSLRYSAREIAANETALPVVGAPEDVNLCPYIEEILPSECSTSGLCHTVSCSLDWTEFVLDATVDIEPCVFPSAVTVSLQLQKPIYLTWSHEWTLDESGQYDIPGASVSIPFLGDEASAGLVVDGDVSGSLSDLELKIGLDVCAKFLDDSYCGADLAKHVSWLQGDIPFWVFDHTFNFDQICASVNAPAREPVVAPIQPDSEAGLTTVQPEAGTNH